MSNGWYTFICSFIFGCNLVGPDCVSLCSLCPSHFSYLVSNTMNFTLKLPNSNLNDGDSFYQWSFRHMKVLHCILIWYYSLQILVVFLWRIWSLSVSYLLQWSRKCLSVISYWGQNWHILPPLRCQVYLCVVQPLCSPSACSLSLCVCLCCWVVLLCLNCDDKGFRIQNLFFRPLFFQVPFLCFYRIQNGSDTSINILTAHKQLENEL